ncbi:hypothetical protein [Allokutzneria sp. NRRL B-24872]|uniref:hypothetical protein n=1 Tax=Allokutzneria sp. NRRL B-24872 TaxID=1137961 RepID=UPI000A392E42|nr:hypothetical protein [Allokutzneria sp. NRRL B-24872]
MRALGKSAATAVLALGMALVTVPSASAGGNSKTCNGSGGHCLLTGSGFPGYTGHVDIDVIGGENVSVHWVFRTGLRRCEGNVRVNDPASSWTCTTMSAPHPGDYAVEVFSSSSHRTIKVGLRW